MKLSKCKVDSTSIKEFQNGTEIENKKFTFYPDRNIEVAYNNIIKDKNFQIPAIAGWQNLFSKEDGTLLNTIRVM